MYRSRLADIELESRLRRAGAVLIEGPKACGKTSTGRQVAASEVILDVTHKQLPYQLILQGEQPRLVDEWQIVPEVWNLIRHDIDASGRKGAYILTGSSTPADDATRHSGAGRFSRLRMRTMSMAETGHSDGSVSLAALMNGSSVISRHGDNGVDAVIDAMCRGGWPVNLDVSRGDASLAVLDYLEEMCRTDVAMVGSRQRSRDPTKLRLLFASLARSAGAPLSVNTIAKDLTQLGVGISDDTVREYLDALEAVMLIERIPVWSTHIRSRATIRSQRKLYLADPSLALAALGIHEQQLVKEPAFMGIVFETLVMRDLLVYSQHAGATLKYYRDSYGTEVDAIIERTTGEWSAIEIKLGSAAVDAAADSLRRFTKTVDTSTKGMPTALIVITGQGPAYTRDDGIHVVPITMLGA